MTRSALGPMPLEFGQFRARDASELPQGCVAGIVQSASRRCANLRKLIKRCRHAERLASTSEHRATMAA